MLDETEPSNSMVIKKKKSSIANEEPFQNKKEKKKNDDQETLTKHKKRKYSLEIRTSGAEEKSIVEITKKKKKAANVNEAVALEIFPCAEDSDLSIENEACNQLESKDKTFCKPEKSKKKNKKDRKVVLLTEDHNNEELQRLCNEKFSTKNKKTKQSTAKEIVLQLETLSKTIASGNSEAHEKTKQKRKLQQPKKVSFEEAHINLETNDETSCKAENSKEINKKKRCKNECIDDQAQTRLEPNDQTFCKPENSKKKNGKKKRCKDNSIDDQEPNKLEPNEETTWQPENSKKKKKRKKQDLLEAEVENNEELQTQNTEKISTKKKKLKPSTAEQSTCQLPSSSEIIEGGTEDVHEERIKKKKSKKRRYEDTERIQPAIPETEMDNGESELGDHILASMSNKKKKKTRVPEAHNNVTTNSDTLSNKDTQDCDKSTNFINMKRHKLDGTISNKIPKSKKKKKKIKFKQEGRSEATECGGDVEIVSMKKGNTDEVQVDKMRRRALQDEVDRASGKVKDSQFGQWQAATFDNPDQKNKFLRLMGGFKKFSPSSPAGTERPNQALSKTGEETLKQNLLSEFEKAMDLKQHRGIGLGFHSASKKTFYIDKTSSSSTKFDD